MAAHDGLELGPPRHVQGAHDPTADAPHQDGMALKASAAASRRAQLAPLVDTAATLCFVCGPESMVEDVPPMLQELGIDRTRIGSKNGSGRGKVKGQGSRF